MALFMGFLSIAEKAGGVGLLSNSFTLSFPKYFLIFQKATRLWGI
jgi:hypothetical protein